MLVTLRKVRSGDYRVNFTRYIEPFEQMVRAGLLPGFIEIYIERDLKLKLSRV